MSRTAPVLVREYLHAIEEAEAAAAVTYGDECSTCGEHVILWDDAGDGIWAECGCGEGYVS